MTKPERIAGLIAKHEKLRDEQRLARGIPLPKSSPVVKAAPSEKAEAVPVIAEQTPESWNAWFRRLWVKFTS